MKAFFDDPRYGVIFGVGGAVIGPLIWTLSDRFGAAAAFAAGLCGGVGLVETAGGFIRAYRASSIER